MPSASVLKVHHYYGLRPRKTSLYNYFQLRDWSAYLGMGTEPKGYAIAGIKSLPLNVLDVLIDFLTGEAIGGASTESLVNAFRLFNKLIRKFLATTVNA